MGTTEGRLALVRDIRQRAVEQGILRYATLTARPIRETWVEQGKEQRAPESDDGRNAGGQATAPTCSPPRHTLQRAGIPGPRLDRLSHKQRGQDRVDPDQGQGCHHGQPGGGNIPGNGFPFQQEAQNQNVKLTQGHHHEAGPENGRRRGSHPCLVTGSRILAWLPSGQPMDQNDPQRRGKERREEPEMRHGGEVRCGDSRTRDPPVPEPQEPGDGQAVGDDQL